MTTCITWPALVLGIALCGAVSVAQGVCFFGQPALADEFAQTTVVVARVHSARDVQDDPDDPVGISATLYTIDVAEHLRGTAARRLELRSNNTSSRFPMEPGRRYLLFVRQAPDGTYYIDACGHSGELPGVLATLAQVRRFSGSAKQHPTRDPFQEVGRRAHTSSASKDGR